MVGFPSRSARRFWQSGLPDFAGGRILDRLRILPGIYPRRSNTAEPLADAVKAASAGPLALRIDLSGL